MQLRGQRRFDGVGRLKFDFHTGAEATARKFGLTLLATTAGPALALVLFLCIGDDWSLAALKTVAVVGLALCAPPALLLLGLRDVGADACDDGDDADEAGDEGIARFLKKSGMNFTVMPDPKPEIRSATTISRAMPCLLYTS